MSNPLQSQSRDVCVPRRPSGSGGPEREVDEGGVPHRLFILNGPNLNMLGRREPHIYGHVTLAEVSSRCHELAEELGFDLFFGQSNGEGQVVEWVHRAYDESASVIINPAGLSTRSVVLYDALRMLSRPVVEVHITNVFGREAVYGDLLTARAAHGLIAGFGAAGYELAMRGLRNLVATPPEGGRFPDGASVRPEEEARCG